MAPLDTNFSSYSEHTVGHFYFYTQTLHLDLFYFGPFLLFPCDPAHLKSSLRTGFLTTASEQKSEVHVCANEITSGRLRTVGCTHFPWLHSPGFIRASISVDSALVFFFFLLFFFFPSLPHRMCFEYRLCAGRLQDIGRIEPD
jgi:hypothetical protein